MFNVWWRSLVAKLFNRKSRSEERRRGKGSRISSYRVWFEPLEDRFAPAVAYTWTGSGGNALWNTTGNWSDSGGTYPVPVQAIPSPSLR